MNRVIGGIQGFIGYSPLIMILFGCLELPITGHFFPYLNGSHVSF